MNMEKIKKRRLSGRFSLFDTCNVIGLGILLFIIVYPIYFTVIASLSDPYSVISGQVYLWVKSLQFDAYRYVFRYKLIWTGYYNSIIYTIGGTVLALCLTIPAAYTLSKKELPGRKVFTTLFLIIMYFSGGLIPTYLIVRGIGLLDKQLTLVIVGSFSVFNLIITRTYFQTAISDSLYEAARMDGSNELLSFFWIALPLSKPIIAVIALYYGVGKWNDFFNALIYIRSDSLLSLQLVLRNILLSSENILKSTDFYGSEEEMAALVRLAYMAQSMKYAIIFIASAPLLMAYPFVQKYFVKGVMIGSVKG